MYSHVHLAHVAKEPRTDTLAPLLTIVGGVRPDAPTFGVIQMHTTHRLTSKRELKTIYGIPYSLTHIGRLEAAGEFPKRIRLGKNRVAWYAHEIEEWIDSRPRVSATIVAAA